MKQQEVTCVADRQRETLWRIWVNTELRVVSFHEIEDGQLLEFRSYELFQACIDRYTAQRYRYQ